MNKNNNTARGCEARRKRLVIAFDMLYSCITLQREVTASA